jgi:hypothetical protein
VIPNQIAFAAIVDNYHETIASMGWDHPPVLGMATGTATSLPGAPTLLAAMPVPKESQPYFAVDGEFTFRHAMIRLGVMAMLTPSQMPTDLGVRLAGSMITAESWTVNEKDRPEEMPSGKGIADLPGAYEVRETVAVDCGGRVYVVRERRGGETSRRIGADDLAKELFVPEMAAFLLGSIVTDPDGEGASDRPALQRLLDGNEWFGNIVSTLLEAGIELGELS